MEVGRGHTRRIGRRRGDRAEREVLVAVVLVPRDLVVIPRRAEHVEIAISIDVRSKYTACEISPSGNSVLTSENTARGGGSRDRHGVVFDFAIRRQALGSTGA